MNRLVYGLDFGTSNSAIAYRNAGQVEIITHGQPDRKTMPSVLFFPHDSVGHFTGEDAIQHYTDSIMDGRLIQSIKSALPEKWLTGTRIQRDWYEIEDLVALIIGDLKQKADAVTGEDVKSVVLGRPARFSQDAEKDEFARERLKTAAIRAGFENIHFQIEPIAAALYYETSLQEAEFVLVADFGGGTSDFTAMQLSPDRIHDRDRRADILGTRGVSVAGDKLDSAIMWHKLIDYFGAKVKWSSLDSELWLDMPVHIMRMICDWRQVPFLRESRQRKRITDIRHWADDPEPVLRLETLIDENLGFSLFKAIEQTKTRLSASERESIEFHHSTLDISAPITRREFESMITEEVGEIEQCLDEFLGDLSLDYSEIHSVFLTGGTAYVPYIRAMLASKFGARKLRQGDAFISVASGLALSSHLYF